MYSVPGAVSPAESHALTGWLFFRTIGTFRISYESNAKRKFDSARNHFLENRIQVSQVVMQVTMATTNTARSLASWRTGVYPDTCMDHGIKGKMCTWQNMCTWPNKCVPDGFGACHE